MKKFREEADSIGKLKIPAKAYYGVQTLRALNNFNITGKKMNIKFIYNIAKIKKAAAIINNKSKMLAYDLHKAIITACDDVILGKFDREFITDAIQGGAGTSVNMNVNEVIANRATELLGGQLGEYICHPNDHVNMSQSTNDVIPTAGKLTILELSTPLIKEMNRLVVAFGKKALEFDHILKMGRTQLEDAIPIRLGQEFAAYASSIKRCIRLYETALEEMYVVNIGGTAIGTALNADKYYLNNIVDELSRIAGVKIKQAKNLIDATQNLDGFVYLSGALKTFAVTISKISNDLRLMASGPKTGFGEIILPAMQNGSSIMPGKVNPVIPEVVSQVAFLIIGNDTTIAVAAESGQLELNAFEPVVFFKLFESITCLTNAISTFIDNCVDGIVANKERCEELLNSSVGMVTALCPYIGYKKAAEIAKESLKTNQSIRSLISKYQLLSEDKLNEILNLEAMT